MRNHFRVLFFVGLIALIGVMCVISYVVAQEETQISQEGTFEEPYSSPGEEEVPKEKEVPVQEGSAPSEARVTRDPFQTNIPGQAPTAPVAGTTEVEVVTNLQGIGMGKRGALAIINGQIYREGEYKGGIEVIKIRKKAVDILINGALTRTLRMTPELGGESHTNAPLKKEEGIKITRDRTEEEKAFLTEPTPTNETTT